jgi:hypothetical protein
MRLRRTIKSGRGGDSQSRLACRQSGATLSHGMTGYTPMKPKLPQPTSSAVVNTDGGKLSEQWDTSLLHQTLGETIRIGFRADHQTCDRLQRHIDRLEDKAPGLVITLSDALRSMIMVADLALNEDDE